VTNPRVCPDPGVLSFWSFHRYFRLFLWADDPCYAREHSRVFDELGEVLGATRTRRERPGVSFGSHDDSARKSVIGTP
jgi:hypothetical protein